MGYFYFEVMAKPTLRNASEICVAEAKCRKIWEIIDRRWTGMLHRPIHAAGAYLNLYFCDKDSMLDDPESGPLFMLGMAHAAYFPHDCAAVDGDGSI